METSCTHSRGDRDDAHRRSGRLGRSAYHHDRVVRGHDPAPVSRPRYLGITIDPVITYQSEDTITTFTDGSGVVRVAYRGLATGVIVEESTGKSVDFFSMLVSVEDPAAGEATLVGVRTRYTAPGEGVLLLSAGRTTFTESGFETVGRNDRGNPEAFRDVCTYLATS